MSTFALESTKLLLILCDVRFHKLLLVKYAPKALFGLPFYPLIGTYLKNLLNICKCDFLLIGVQSFYINPGIPHRYVMCSFIKGTKKLYITQVY